MAPAQSIDRYLKDSSARPSLYINVPTSPSTSSSKFGLPTEYPYPQSASSVASTCRSPASDGGSQISSAPTSATSTAPSIGTMEPSYWLQCTFRETECKVQFYPEDYAAWYAHCLSHWNGYPPPRACLCIFCNKEFDGNNGWYKRMSHIARHLRDGLRVEDGFPDFAVYRHMYSIKLLTKADYVALTEFSECESEGLGLLPLDYQVAKVRDDVVVDDQRKEDRERKAARSQKKGKGRK